MHTLVIDTATEACSVALFDGDKLIAGNYAKLGRGHAERLVPMIAALPGNGKADAIIVNCGPGSFTGLRVGLSAAKALGLAWSVPVTGYNCLGLVAIMALVQQDGVDGVDVAMHGGHGEFFVQPYAPDGKAAGELASLTPEIAAARLQYNLIAGSGSEKLVSLCDNARALSLWPDARQAMRLPEHARALPAEPVYGRAPDAKPMAQQAKTR
ncbi:tRNA (adenosine(37)-N6)-threonylcarbamoyltransferase complex dimerization subunit type 1 TsaB [Sphingorhabdus sp. Alg239-R122]|uniref:tRNA (adenosine(37)-N6)-threonylcarbamoyltransferase complex dimerization subunit type 1 TsaB n=1 Tax=Sphingorhabdus sp. Alg239-R122 TaxID=2305989 RepID=UPI0013DD0986|nr:tRNA (adenosine(37)-N6)-threonylcarbamoyltransferase complex dimerization subunit type 1 TsaB [Sphingorhabdus sp. Alg239-R122]